MIDIQTFGVWGWDGAIYGMRAAHESWKKSDTLHAEGSVINSGDNINGNPHKFAAVICHGIDCIGKDDVELMKRLASCGDDEGKFLRCIHVQTWIKAPIRWWVEMDTYKVGTTRLSTSLMHKVLNTDGDAFTMDDFSTDHLISRLSWDLFEDDIEKLNTLCENYRLEYAAETREKVPHVKSKQRWYEIQELVPRCYNYRSILDLNYATLRRIAHSERRNHKQDEWREGFFDWMRTLPLAEELIFSPYVYEKEKEE